MTAVTAISFIFHNKLVSRFPYVTSDANPTDTHKRHNDEKLIVLPFSFLSKHDTRVHTNGARTRTCVTRASNDLLVFPWNFQAHSRTRLAWDSRPS